MKVSVLSDSSWEAKLEHAMKGLRLCDVFATRDYGPSLSGLTVVFICLDPALKLKRRVRYAKKERHLYMDIMLHLPELLPLSHADRRKILADRLLKDIPDRLREYKLPDFDYGRFEPDWRAAITEQLLGPDASRFDHQCKPQATR